VDAWWRIRFKSFGVGVLLYQFHNIHAYALVALVFSRSFSCMKNMFSTMGIKRTPFARNHLQGPFSCRLLHHKMPG
jgi:hypothetical protein